MLEYEKINHNMYITTAIKHQSNIKKIFIIILIIMVIIGLIMIAKNAINMIQQYKVYKQYEAQLIALKKQEEEKQTQIDRKAEETNQEKIPKLTQKRKREYGKYLSF